MCREILKQTAIQRVKLPTRLSITACLQTTNICCKIKENAHLCEIVLLYFRRDMLFGRSGSFIYSAIHSIKFEKVVTANVQNKRSVFHPGACLLQIF